MTSRAFRKLERINAQAESTEETVEKLKEDDANASEEESEDEEPQQRGNVFAALLGEEPEDEQEDEDSEEEDIPTRKSVEITQPSIAGKKKRGKKKGLSRAVTVETEEEEDIDAILAELALKEETTEQSFAAGKKKDSSGKSSNGSSAAYRLLSVDPKNLDADAEMKRMFGAIVLQQEQAPAAAAGRGRGGRSTTRGNKRALLAAHKDTWPRMTKLGLDMQSLGQDSQGTRYILTRNTLLTEANKDAIYLHLPIPNSILMFRFNF
jgi:hypothetical protein